MGKAVGKIDDVFPDGALYVRITSAWLLDHAHDANFTLPQRIEFAAWSRVNRSGHAQFAAGELAMILGKQGSHGWARASAASVSHALRRAKADGRIEPGSGARCVILSADHVNQGRLGGFGCQHHRLAVLEPYQELSPAA